jgi:hypothetical protein
MICDSFDSIGKKIDVIMTQIFVGPMYHNESDYQSHPLATIPKSLKQSMVGYLKTGLHNFISLVKPAQIDWTIHFFMGNLKKKTNNLL